MYGNMVTSSETHSLAFLDGGVHDTRGLFDSSCGMFCSGRLATAYVVYQLGGNARALLKDASLPTAAELQLMIDEAKSTGR